MEPKDKSEQDCECGNDCCQPTARKPWTKIVFFIVIIAALAIVAIKLSHSDNPGKAGSTTDTLTTVKPGSADAGQTKSCSSKCDTSIKSNCCPQSKK